MNDVPTTEGPDEGEPGIPEQPAAQAWNPRPWATEAAPGFTPVTPMMTEVLGLEDVVAEPRKRRRWLRRTLLSLVALLVIGGLVGGSLAYLDHRRDVQHKKEVAAKLAAERKAEAAYVAKIRPLAVRVFDAVQPIEDVYDSSGHRRPGYPAARDDVIQHGGALRDLKAVRLALSRLKAPDAYVDTHASMLRHLDRLVDAITALEKSSHERGNASGIITSYGPRFVEFQSAAITWSGTVSVLDDKDVWPRPSEDRALAHGRKAATVGGFIVGSDLACGKSSAALAFEDYKHPDKLVTSTYPKISKQFRDLATRLKAVAYPSKERATRHRLELGWTSMADVATEMDAVTRAYERRDVKAFESSFDRMRDALDGLNDLALAYKSVGAMECYRLFVVDDGKKGTSTSRT